MNNPFNFSFLCPHYKKLSRPKILQKRMRKRYRQNKHQR